LRNKGGLISQNERETDAAAAAVYIT
jgi:hypothetical protein